MYLVRRPVISFALWAILFSGTSNASDKKTDEELRQIDEQTIQTLFNFLKDEIEGRIVHLPKNLAPLDGGAKLSDVTAEAKYANVRRTPTGIKFEYHWKGEQTLYHSKINSEGIPEVDSAGLPVPDKLWKTMKKSGVNECHLRVASSTGKVLGICIPIKNALIDPTGYGYSIRISLDKDILTLKKTTMLYSDFYGNGRLGTYPGNSDDIITLQVDDGKLVQKITSYSYVYDLEKGTRKPKMFTRKVDGKIIEEHQIRHDTWKEH